jgi:hypothetical protein
MTRHDASGTRSCSNPSRSGLTATACGGATTDDIGWLRLYRMRNEEFRISNEEMKKHIRRPFLRFSFEIRNSSFFVILGTQCLLALR